MNCSDLKIHQTTIYSHACVEENYEKKEKQKRKCLPTIFNINHKLKIDG